MDTPQTAESAFQGMTVNERLGEAGLFVEFDHAAYAHDTKKLRTVLAKVDIQGESATRIIDWVITSPDSQFRNRRFAKWPLVILAVVLIVGLIFLRLAGG